MEEKLSEVLDNLLGLLLLEGSYEIEEDEDGVHVLVETKDAGRLIGARGESLESLQLLINQIISQKMRGVAPKQEGLAPSASEGFKRVILDVGGWRKQKEEDLKGQSEAWGKQVVESGKDLELEPMSPWQRRVVHMVISEMAGVESESAGEGRDRHVVIKSLSRAKSRDEED